MATNESTMPQLLGANYSVYTRIAQLTLLEKRIDFTSVEIDIFGADVNNPTYLKLHPFARIPTFRHGDFTLYETAAITRYIDETFPGPPLQPIDVQARARMIQMISIMDSYLYQPLIWGIYVAIDDAAKANTPIDAAALSDAMAKARIALMTLDDMSAPEPFLLGEALSLADLHLLPMLAYSQITAEGRRLLAERKKLQNWLERMQARSSVTTTHFPAEGN